MTLYKLIGYNPQTQIYTNPTSGLVENIPDDTFRISDSLPNSNYESYDNPEYWSMYAESLLNSVSNFSDYLKLRYEIYTRIEAISGTDYTNWDNLTSIQKSVALIWCNIRIINTRGIIFYITECGSEQTATKNVESYFQKSTNARKKRYDAYSNYGYTYLGKIQGLKAENYARKDFLDNTYITRGVVYFVEDGINGIGDWILGLNDYVTTGLKPRIVNGEFVLSGISVDDFCNTLVAIVYDGDY